MTKRVRAGLMLMGALAMMGLAGCGHYICSKGANFGSSSCSSSGGGGGGSAATAFAFAVDAGGTIDGFTLSTGGRTFTGTPGYSAPATPLGLEGAGMVVAQGKYLYTSFQQTGQIYGWSISSTGGLTAINGSPFSASYMITSAEGSMITNPAGTLLFVPDEAGDSVYVYQIGSGGVLSAGSPFALGFLPISLGTDGAGKYLYVTNGSSGEIAAFAIGGTGTLSAVQGSPFPYPMYRVQGDPSGNYLIGTTSIDGDQHLYVFRITQLGTSEGAITPVAGSPFTTQYSPYSIAVQPNSGGDLVYSFSLSGTSTVFNPIEGYQLNTTTGALAAVSGSPFSALSNGLLGQFDQSGQFLFVYASNDSTGTPVTDLAAFSVASDGTLTQPIPQLTLATPGVWAVTDPN